MRSIPLCLLLALLLLPVSAFADTLPRIVVSPDGKDFRQEGTDKSFYLWGVNYDHDNDGHLLEDYWHNDWKVIEEDFAEIKSLGANVVRVHLQVAKFMDSPTETNQANLKKLADLIALADRNQLYLDITGLGCYHKQDVPEWYDAMNEADRWQVQANFWQAIAKVGNGHSAVFCYDLMNEPVLGGGKNPKEWLVGEPLGGNYFVQRITNDVAGREGHEIAAAWVKKLTGAIRAEDKKTLMTVGVIPWATVWPTAKPLFYSDQVGGPLDFVCVHFYPQADKVDQAITALKVYDVGKPLVIEEFFPLKCSLEEAETFLKEARPITDGVISFYWGKTRKEYEAEGTMQAAIVEKWLETFERLAPKNK
ncbi:cellulase family glycosylhydrolase [bacterium]|nr:cellulase family glycosylhydrolase [bacterium]